MNNKYKIPLIIILLVFLTSVSIALYYNFAPDEPAMEPYERPSGAHSDLSDNIDIEELDAAEGHSPVIMNTDADTIHLSDSPGQTGHSADGPVAFTVDTAAGSSKKIVYSGKRINISITGLDGRLGRLSKLADANHVVSILIETGQIEIISIPRDSYVDLEYDDTLNLNKLTICRAKKGRNRYHQELARIAGLDKIHYWVEFGFSQAMGIIEFLGYDNPQNTLQVLRSRKGLGGDDYQRCYSQGQFIRQAMLGHFDKFTGTMGGLLARAGLMFVETNLTGDVVSDIISRLDGVGFPKSPDMVTVRVRPSIKVKYKVYDFSDTATVAQLTRKIENFNQSRFNKDIDSPQPRVDVLHKLNDVLAGAVADTAKRPAGVISKLGPYFEQRAWHQISDRTERERVRAEFQKLLTLAYTKRNKQAEVDKVNAVMEAEKQLFNSSKKN